MGVCGLFTMACSPTELLLIKIITSELVPEHPSTVYVYTTTYLSTKSDRETGVQVNVMAFDVLVAVKFFGDGGEIPIHATKTHKTNPYY